MASQWARLAEPPLAVACFYNRVDEVKRLLAGGADVLERIPRNSTPRPPPFNRRRWSPFAGGLAIHVCCYFAHFECLHSLLATGIRGQVDAGFEGMDGIGSTEEDTDVTPIIALCLRAGYQSPPELVTDDGELGGVSFGKGDLIIRLDLVQFTEHTRLA